MNNTVFGLKIVDKASQPFRKNKKNDYSCFEELKNSFGVYIFQNKESGEVLYVGEASVQCLKKRITQNYTGNDTGGTFRKNYCKLENKKFTDFKQMLGNCKVNIILISNKKYGNSKELIRVIEATLIAVLVPRYNNS